MRPFRIYLETLERLETQKLPLDWQESMPTDYKAVYLRHDVDSCLDHALRFARKEAEAGYRSTYFLHPNRGYFNYSDVMADKCKVLLDMGHTIGFHNCFVARWLTVLEKPDRPPGMPNDPILIDKWIEKPLAFLRSRTKAVVIGTACHGSAICKTNKVFNYDCWTESTYEVKDIITSMPRFSLGDFGLLYEAYFLPRDAYLSDNHGGWSGGIGSEIAPFEVDQASNGTETKNSIIKRFNGMETGVCQVLSHPQHWTLG